MAFLIGGLTINANAQEKKVEKKAKVENTQNQKKLGVNKAVDIDKMLKDYGTNVDKYIETYKAALKGDKSVNKNTYEGYKKTAQKLEGQLEKIKEDMSPTQVKIFEKTKAKFAEALTEKGQK